MDIHFFEKQPRSLLLAIGLGLNCLVGFFDYLSGYRIGIEAFYLLPVLFVTWFVSKEAGIFLSCISTATIVLTNLPRFYEHYAIETWSTFMHFCFFIIFVLLLSRIRNAFDERSRLLGELQRSYKDMESFSYAASHDLRSPLIAIEGFSRILEEDYGGSLDEKGRDLLSRIRAGARKMSQLIEDLLSFSRVSAKEVKRSEIEMGRLAGRVFEELKPTMGDREIKLEVGDLPPANGDIRMIHQVYQNLISNAIKFTRKKETPEIEVRSFQSDAETVYYVKDNGAGFNPDLSSKLFNLFQRAHSVTEFEGTGIGLVVVKRIIEKHGGRVWAEGSPDHGATFYFTLPRSRR